MTSTPDSVSSAKQSVHASDGPLWLVAVAKAGYGARGFVYLAIGALTLLQAFGQGGGRNSSRGAIDELLGAPGGLILLWLLALGLLCYSLWRLCQAFLDADHHGTDAKGLVVRGGMLVSALTHIALAFYTASVAWHNAGSSSGSGGGGNEGLVARIMAWPGGTVVVIIIGLCIIGAGVAHAVKARKEKYEERFTIDRGTMEKLEPICKFGLYARSLVFLILGSMFIFAAVTQDPSDAGGVREVLDKVSEQAYGMILLSIVAAGLFAFGLYSCFEAAYRRINDPWE